MADKKKDIQELLRNANPLSEFRDLLNPPHMRAIREQMERVESIINPPHLALARAAMAAAASSSHQALARAAVEAAINPPYLEQARLAMESAINPPHLELARAAMEAATNIPQLAQLAQAREAVEAAWNPSHLAQARAAMEAAINATHAVRIREQMEALSASSALEEMAKAAVRASMTTELARTVSSYQELVSGSALASYLVTTRDDGKPPVQAVEVEGFDSLAVGDFAELEIDDHSKIDHQIVQAIQTGQVAQLPEPAMQRLRYVYARIVTIWDMLLRIFNTCMAVVFLTTLMSNTTVPSDIPKQTEKLSNEQRELLADHRVVNRNGARLRTEASTHSQAVSSLKLGTLVEVIEYNDKGWYRVVTEIDGKSVQGWMYVTVTTPVPKPKYPRGHFVVAESE